MYMWNYSFMQTGVGGWGTHYMCVVAMYTHPHECIQPLTTPAPPSYSDMHHPHPPTHTCTIHTLLLTHAPSTPSTPSYSHMHHPHHPYPPTHTCTIHTLLLTHVPSTPSYAHMYHPHPPTHTCTIHTLLLTHAFTHAPSPPSYSHMHHHYPPHIPPSSHVHHPHPPHTCTIPTLLTRAPSPPSSHVHHPHPPHTCTIPTLLLTHAPPHPLTQYLALCWSASQPQGAKMYTPFLRLVLSLRVPYVWKQLHV